MMLEHDLLLIVFLMSGGRGRVKEHVVPPCLALVIDDNLYGLMVALSYI